MPAWRSDAAATRRPVPRFSHTVRPVSGTSTSSRSLASTALREAVAADANRYVQGLAPVQANEVVVSNGSKQSLYNACVCCFCPGDVVLIATPKLTNY